MANNLSFSISVRNSASPALTSLSRQVNSLKTGLQSIGNSANATTSSTNKLASGLKSVFNNVNATSNYLNSLNRNVGSTSRSFGTLGSAVTRTIGIFGGFKIVNSIFNSVTSSLSRAIERLDTMDLFEQKMTLITRNSELASEALDHMQKSTKGTPYALDIAAKSVQNFVLRGMQIQDATKSVDIWMDAVSTYGKGTNEQFESVMDAIAKMRTKGTVEMRYLNRLFAAGINPVQMYATATGQASEDVQTALSNKDISSKEFLDVVETAMREGTNGVLAIEGNAKKFATTWTASIANMSIAIARGVAQVADGLDNFFGAFSDKGLKGIILGYGEAIENFLTPIGKGLTKAGSLIKGAFNQIKGQFLTNFTFIENRVADNAEAISKNYEATGNHFRDSFFKTFSPYLAQAILNFENLRMVWSDVAETFSAGITKISAPLARFVGTYLGETILGVEDLGEAFGKWLNLKLPVFFDKLRDVLNWFTEHKDSVVNSAKLIIKAMLGFTVLNTIQNVLVGFNDKLKALNNTLAFFTLGKFQIPTLENLVLNNGGGNLTKQFKKISDQNESLKNKTLSTIAIPPITPQKNPNKIKNKVSGVVDPTYYKTAQTKKYDIKRISNKNKLYQKDKVIPSYSTNRNKVALFTDETKLKSQPSTSARNYQTDLIKNFQPITLKRNKLPENDLDSVMESRLKSNKSLQKAENELAKYYQRIPLNGNFTSSRGKSTMSYTPTLGGRFTNWMAEGLVNAKNSGKNAYKYVKDSTVATGKGIKDTAVESGILLGRGLSNGKNGLTNFFKNTFGGKGGLSFAEEFTQDMQDARDVTTKAGKGIGSTISEFFGTMFSGFKGLKSGDKTPKTSVVGSLKKGWDWLNTDAQGNKTFKKSQLTSMGSGAKNVAGGVGNFFGTMFSGFKGLGKGQSATTAMNLAGEAAEAEVAAEKTGLLATVITKLSTAFQAVSGWVTSFVATIGGAVTAVGLAVVAIGALAAGLGVLNPGNTVSNGINAFFESFFEWCSTVAENAPILIQNFVDGLISNLPTLTEQGVNLLLAIVNGILTGIPKMLTAGVSILFALIGGIAQVLPELVTSGFNAIGQFIAGIIQNIPNILSAAWEFIVTLNKGIMYNLPIIIAAGIKTVVNFILGIGSMVGQVWNAIVDLVKSGWEYITQHPEAILEAIGNACVAILDSFNQGLWKAADMLGIGGFLEDVLGLQRPEKVAEEGATAAQSAINGANENLRANSPDFLQFWQNGNTDDATQAAQQAGTDVAAGFTDSVDAEMVQAAIDAGQAGTDTAMNYTDNLASGITTGGENVDQALSSVGSEGLANIQVNFNSEQVAQAGADFMNKLNASINENAFTVYQSIAVFCNNVLTQLSAGLNNPEASIPETISSALVGLLSSITQQVNDYCTQINTKLTDTYNGLITTIDTTLTTFATKHTDTINAIFPAFQNDIESHLNDAVQKYENFSQSIHKKLDDLNSYHYSIGVAMMDSLAKGISDTRPKVETVESELVQKLKDTFEKGMGIHSPADQWIWYGQMMIAGLLEGLEDSKVQKFVNNIVDDMNIAFGDGKFGQINADQTVNFLTEQGTLDLIGKVNNVDLSGIGEQQIAYPLAGGVFPITSTFGGREAPTAGASTNHQAVDIGAPSGTPILSILGGTVTQAGWNGGYGNSVTVDHGNGLTSLYGHMSAVGTNAGAVVKKGQNIGQVGSTGVSTGAHLHLGMFQNGTAIDPEPYLGGAGIVAGNTLAALLQTAYNKKYHPELAAAATSMSNYNPSGGAAQWASLVLQALKMLGQPASLLNGVLYAIESESGGNPNAINLTDSNAAAGHPSQGLLQTIPSTFFAYALPGYNTLITDPLSNILAGLNYMIHAYGGISNVISKRSGGWFGYAVGTRNVPYDMPAMIHKGEAIIPASQNPYSASGGDYLADLFNNAIGNAGINDLGFDLSSMDNGSSSSNNINNNLNNVFNIHNDSDVNADRNVGNIENVLHKMLQDGMRAGSSR